MMGGATSTVPVVNKGGKAGQQLTLENNEIQETVREKRG